MDNGPRRRATDHPRPRAVVTGAAGFLASHLSERLIDSGWDVIGLDNMLTGRMENLSKLLSRPEFTFERHDVTTFIHVGGAVDAVLHFASPASPQDYLEHPIKTMKVGALGTHNTLGLALSKQARYLLASTSEVYGDPRVHPQPETYWGNVNPIGPRGVYDEAKRFAEALTLAYHRAHGLDVRIVRIFNTYGPRLRPADGRVVSNFLVQAMEGKPLTIYGDGEQSRSFCYVDDLVGGIVSLLRSDHVGPVNIGNPNEFTILELARGGARGHRLCVGDHLRAAPRRRPDPAPAGHHAGARDARLGARGAAAGRADAHLRVVPEGTGSVSEGGSGHEVRRPERPEVVTETVRGQYDPVAYKKLSVIVPVFNERNTVVEILRRMRAVELPLDREFIVVDDGSDDGTRAVLTQLGDSTVKIVSHPQNRGKGAAIRTGLEHVTGDLVLIQDADLEYDPDDWSRLLAPMLKGRAQVVYGSRFTGEHRNMLFLHWAGNKALSLTTNLLYNTTLSDMETCYKLFDREVIRDITLKSDRFDFEPEITAKVLRKGIRIYEVPISYAGREFDEGKKITWRDGFAALYALVKYRFVE